MGNRLQGRDLFVSDMMRLVKVLQVVGPALGGLMIVVGARCPGPKLPEPTA
jgi:hypothetical protein